MIDRQALDLRIEKWLNFLIWFFLLAGLILIAGKKSWWPEFYSPKYFSIIFFLSAMVILLPRYIYRSGDERKREAVLFFRFILAIALIGNALGELYLYQLYKYGIQYDKLLHLVSPFLLVMMLTFFWQIWHEASFGRALVVAALLVLAGSLIWEVFEFLSDLIFKTQEFGIYGQYKLADTVGDIIADIVGIGLSSIVLLMSGYRKRL